MVDGDRSTQGAVEQAFHSCTAALRDTLRWE
jgi:hypothetical protein